MRTEKKEVIKRKPKLSFRDIRLGIQKSWRNSRDLFDEADLLYKNQIYPRSVALYLFCIEEIGKGMMLERASEKKIKDWRKFWKDFYNHEPKWNEIIKYFEEGGIKNAAAKMKYFKQKGTFVDLRERAVYAGFSVKNYSFYKPAELNEYQGWARQLRNLTMAVIVSIIINNLKVFMNRIKIEPGLNREELKKIKDEIESYKAFFDKYFSGDYSKIDKLTQRIDQLIEEKSE